MVSHRFGERVDLGEYKREQKSAKVRRKSVVKRKRVSTRRDATHFDSSRNQIHRRRSPQLRLDTLILNDELFESLELLVRLG